MRNKSQYQKISCQAKKTLSLVNTTQTVVMAQHFHATEFCLHQKPKYSCSLPMHVKAVCSPVLLVLLILPSFTCCRLFVLILLFLMASQVYLHRFVFFISTNLFITIATNRILCIGSCILEAVTVIQRLSLLSSVPKKKKYFSWCLNSLNNRQRNSVTQRRAEAGKS